MLFPAVLRQHLSRYDGQRYAWHPTFVIDYLAYNLRIRPCEVVISILLLIDRLLLAPSRRDQRQAEQDNRNPHYITVLFLNWLLAVLCVSKTHSIVFKLHV